MGFQENSGNSLVRIIYKSLKSCNKLVTNVFLGKYVLLQVSKFDAYKIQYSQIVNNKFASGSTRLRYPGRQEKLMTVYIQKLELTKVRLITLAKSALRWKSSKATNPWRGQEHR